MLKSLGSRWPLSLVLNQELGYEVLGLIGDAVPYWVCKGELTYFHLLHDLLVTGTIEWRDTRQHNISYDAARPDIALGAIVLCENLWGNIVRSTELFVKLLVLVDD